jgi:hypothetical protein
MAFIAAGIGVLRLLIEQYRSDHGLPPPTLGALVDQGYIRWVPYDPITRRNDIWIETREPGEGGCAPGIVQVHSGASGRAHDGTRYADWGAPPRRPSGIAIGTFSPVARGDPSAPKARRVGRNTRGARVSLPGPAFSSLHGYHVFAMIQSFADVATADLFAGRSTRAARRIPGSIWHVARRPLKWIAEVDRCGAATLGPREPSWKSTGSAQGRPAWAPQHSSQ